MNNHSIEEKANVLLKKINYNGGEVNIIEVAHNLGFIVGIAELFSNDNGFIMIDNSKEKIQDIIGLPVSKVIGVNVHNDLQTKRFTIAHTLGHYELHFDNSFTSFTHRENIGQGNVKEYEANYFALCLLMPQKYFMQKYNELKSKDLSKEDIIILLSKHFNVPNDKVQHSIDIVKTMYYN